MRTHLPVLDTEGAAEKLQIGISTLTRWVRKDVGPNSYMVKRKLYFREEDLDDFAKRLMELDKAKKNKNKNNNDKQKKLPNIDKEQKEVKDEQKEAKKGRKSWDAYFIDIAYLVSERSTCMRRKVGAVAVRNKQILSTGYNGAPSGLLHCTHLGVACMREQQGVPSGKMHELCRGLHAEQNVIIQAATSGVSLQWSTLYLTNAPCLICAKMIINTDFARIVCAEDYNDEQAKRFLNSANIDLEVL